MLGNNINIDKEAAIFSKYLINALPTQADIKLYKDAVASSPSISKSDQKLLAYIHKHPWSLRFIDAALPFYRPHSEVRRRIYLILAILEASPDHSDAFIPNRKSPLYILRVGISMMGAIVKLACGLVIVRTVC
jgi:hypothetical protein